MAGKFLSLDEFIEELVRFFKQLYKLMGRDILDKYSWEVTVQCTVYFIQIKEDIIIAKGVRKWSRNHIKKDQSTDITVFRDYLLENQLVEFVAGRGSNYILYYIAVGLQRIVDGLWWQEYLLWSPGYTRVMNQIMFGRRQRNKDEEMTLSD